jgi:voltage-gated sodium channel
VYGVVGFYVFGQEDPERWGTLGAAFLTLFQMITLEGWVDVQNEVLDAYPWAWIYFASFVFITVSGLSIWR